MASQTACAQVPHIYRPVLSEVFIPYAQCGPALFSMNGGRAVALWQMREIAHPDGLACPDCRSSQIIRWGLRSGVQRYRCKQCRRCFTELTGTAMEGLHKRDKWYAFCDCMAHGHSIRHAAELLNLASGTVLSWRHKLLNRLEKADKQVRLDGLVELAQFPVKDIFQHTALPALERTWFLMGLDRRGSMRCALISNRPEEGHQQALDGMAASGAFLMEMRHLATRQPERECSYSICWVEGMRGRQSRVDTVGSSLLHHTRNARHLVRVFRRWLRGFHGVSQKHLLRYFSWFARSGIATGLTLTSTAESLLNLSVAPVCTATA